MSQITPWTKTLCSYSATSLPSAAGVSRSSRMRVRRAIAGEDLVRHELGRDALGGDLFRRLAERERLGLREQVRHQQIVVLAERVQAVR